MASASTRMAAIIALLAMTGCAATDTGTPAQPRAARQCFWPRNVSNFRVVNPSTVNIRAGRTVFRLDMFGNCPNLGWSETMALVTRGSSTICTGSVAGASIVVREPGGRGRQRCSVRTVTALTPEEVEALPARERP